MYKFRSIINLIKRVQTIRVTNRRFIRPLSFSTNQNFNSEQKFQSYQHLTPIFLVGAIGVAFCSSEDKEGSERLLFQAAQFGDLSVVKKLLKNNVNINARHELGWTPLMTAVVNSRYDVVRFLLEAGADPNLSDEFQTPRRTANVKNMHYLDVLMTRETKFSSRLNNSMSFRGFTALHYAVLNDDMEIVELLIEHGANPTLEDEAGQQPILFSSDSTIKSYLETKAQKFEEIKKEKEIEERRRFPLEERLKRYIVGQEGAITVVSATIRRKENGWSDDDHPLVFLFLGSSGIGKTELAKQLARYIHKDKPEAFIRLDMSEFQEKHEVAKLIGAPPGYIGHDEGGQLTSRLKQCPKAVVLFDEVDKAHPDVLTVLLQLFDEGRLTDGHGKTIECKDAVFVMTSNLASEEIAEHGLQLRQEIETLRKNRLVNNKTDEDISDNITVSRKFRNGIVKPILKRHFKRDEFLGRINEIVYFLPFSRNELIQLVDRELEIWAKRALDKHKIILKWDKSVQAVLADGYDVNYGARSIKYEVERRVVNQLAAANEEGAIGKGSIVEITASVDNEQTVPEIKLKIDNSKLKTRIFPKNTFF